MAEYDETEDIDLLLRSSLRGDQTNSTPSANTAMGGSHMHPESDDSETRRRRTRLGDNSCDELHPLTEEEQSNEQRAALQLNAAIPEKARTPLQKKIGTRIDQDLWEDCDRGIAAQMRLTGTHVTCG